MQAAGFFWISLIAAPGVPFVDLVPPLILAGGGVSMAMPAAQNAVLGAVATNEVGKTFGVAFVVAVFEGSGSVVSARAFSDGFAAAIAVSAVLSLAAAIAALALPAKHASARSSEVSRVTLPTNRRCVVFPLTKGARNA